ncbi:copper resistance protein CopD [Planotetraspora kaengkrachanensis]|uniref:Copper resistance protein CopD n=2 Tax=Planotetraspora kaengkrachanensis TaxID=575193 RepID=A0A8J3PQ60_9ACTN|nr:copper resistance protein CopD [Planotetraspora kaengkrachanensis]
MAWLLVISVGSAAVAVSLTAPEAVPGLPPPGPVVRLGLPAARVLVDVAATAVVGLSLLAKLLGFDRPELTEPVMRTARRWAVRAAFVWACSAVVAVVLQASEAMSPSEFPSLAQLAAYVGQISSPKGLLASAAFGMLAAAFCKLAIRYGESVPAELRIVVSLFGLLPLPVTGHAAQWYWHDLSMVSMELHITGAALWAGGLFAMTVLVAARRDLLVDALPRFSKLATVCLLVVGASGLVNGLTQLALDTELPGSLLTSPYGQLVIAKTACLVVVAVLGAKIRWRLMPWIRRGERTSLFAWAFAEVTVMAIAYGIAVVLSRASIAP